MIKLFWNTQNQIKPNKNQTDEEGKRNYYWGLYHKKSSDKWIYEILNKVQFKIIEDENQIENDDVLVIVDSSLEKKHEFYEKLKLVCSKIFLIHLGDESGIYDLTSVYKNCNYVWKTFCSNKYFNNERVSCLPVGYKSGTAPKPTNAKKYKWAFIGTQHKSSRHDLLFQLSKIEPNYCYKTEKFDVKPLDTSKMSEILSLTEFMPCPNGFVHPETYRLYEALECECIPIVENAYKYYDRLFPKNPFLKVDKWMEAKSIIQEWKPKQIEEKREDCKIWWKQYKNNLQDFIKNKIIS
tara:strand:+ start:22 stop:906 length:885 start_codon:yes stop_codon:yes gene_type:complete